MPLNPMLVQTFLDAVDYPADKGHLLAVAKDVGAGDALEASLAAIPEREYATAEDVADAISAFG